MGKLETLAKENGTDPLIESLGSANRTLAFKIPFLKVNTQYQYSNCDCEQHCFAKC